jgi:hypothetical protein
MVLEPVNDHMIGQNDNVDPRAFSFQLGFYFRKVLPEERVLLQVKCLVRVLCPDHVPFFRTKVGVHIFLQERDRLSDLGPAFALVARLKKLADAFEQFLVLFVDLNDSYREVIGPGNWHDRYLLF